MKLFFLLTFGLLCKGNLLERGYLPPPGAKVAGGSPGVFEVLLETPLETPKDGFLPGPVRGLPIGSYNIRPTSNNYETTSSRIDKLPSSFVNVPTTAHTSFSFSQTTTYSPMQDSDCTEPQCNLDGSALQPVFDGSKYPPSSKFPSAQIPSAGGQEIRFDQSIIPGSGTNYVSSSNTESNTLVPENDHVPPTAKFDAQFVNGIHPNQSPFTDQNTFNTQGTHSSGVLKVTKNIQPELNQFTTVDDSGYARKLLGQPGDDASNESSSSQPMLFPSRYDQMSEKTIAESLRPQSDFERNATILKYDNIITPEGYFSYSYDASNGIHADESGDASDGVKAEGSFSYTGDDGKLYIVKYTADENGYVPKGDHLPTPPPIPEAIQKVIEQITRDKAAGKIPDQGLYDEQKYGHRKYQGKLGLKQSIRVPDDDNFRSIYHDGDDVTAKNKQQNDQYKPMSQTSEAVAYTPDGISSEHFKPIYQDGIDATAQTIGKKGQYKPSLQNSKSFTSQQSSTRPDILLSSSASPIQGQYPETRQPESQFNLGVSSTTFSPSKYHESETLTHDTIRQTNKPLYNQYGEKIANLPTTQPKIINQNSITPTSGFSQGHPMINNNLSGVTDKFERVSTRNQPISQKEPIFQNQNMQLRPMGTEQSPNQSNLKSPSFEYADSSIEQNQQPSDTSKFVGKTDTGIIGSHFKVESYSAPSSFDRYMVPIQDQKLPGRLSGSNRKTSHIASSISQGLVATKPAQQTHQTAIRIRPGNRSSSGYLYNVPSQMFNDEIYMQNGMSAIQSITSQPEDFSTVVPSTITFGTKYPFTNVENRVTARPTTRKSGRPSPGSAEVFNVPGEYSLVSPTSTEIPVTEFGYRLDSINGYPSHPQVTYTQPTVGSYLPTKNNTDTYNYTPFTTNRGSFTYKQPAYTTQSMASGHPSGDFSQQPQSGQDVQSTLSANIKPTTTRQQNQYSNNQGQNNYKYPKTSGTTNAPLASSYNQKLENISSEYKKPLQTSFVANQTQFSITPATFQTQGINHDYESQNNNKTETQRPGGDVYEYNVPNTADILPKNQNQFPQRDRINGYPRGPAVSTTSRPIPDHPTSPQGFVDYPTTSGPADYVRAQPSTPKSFQVEPRIPQRESYPELQYQSNQKVPQNDKTFNQDTKVQQAFQESEQSGTQFIEYPTTQRNNGLISQYQTQRPGVFTNPQSVSYPTTSNADQIYSKQGPEISSDDGMQGSFENNGLPPSSESHRVFGSRIPSSSMVKGETFSPSRHPPRYDPETGYHY